MTSIRAPILALALPLALLLPSVTAQASLARARDVPSQKPAQVLVMLRLPPPHLRAGTSNSGSYGDASSQAARRRTAERAARERGMRVSDGWPMPLLGVDCFVFDLPAGLSVERAIELLSQDKAVLWAQPMQTYKVRSGQRDTDPLYPVQPAAIAWRLSDLHRYATGRGITVAVIDSRVETSHPDLAGQFSFSQDFVGGPSRAAEQHGTGVAGVIAAKANNGLGIAGVAPQVRLMALRACWEGGSGSAPTLCNTLSLAKALHFAIDHNANIINMSLSGPSDLLLGKLLDVAAARRIAVVAAYDADAGNGGFPASKPGVIAVADESLRSRPATVYGAPGQDIPTTKPGGRWYVVNGSSYAVAHVSGLLALVRERRRGQPLRLAVRGSGNVVDACATLLSVTRSCDCSCAFRAMAKTSAKR
jgi:hypothetical protein